jgi:hypothetical protein
MRKVLVCFLLLSGAAMAEDRREVVQIDGTEQVVFVLSDTKPMLDQINESARQWKLGETFSECQPAIDVAFGRGSNYGGYCKAGSGRRMLVCADTMVGNFNTSPRDGDTPAIEELTRFVLGNCAGG